MRYSKLFGKTTKNVSRDATMISHKLLLQGGFIKESTAGRYYYLPLGWRVHQKIHDVIKEEMDASGAQEMISPTLHPLELWAETNRTSTTGFELMKVKDRSDREFALGGTAEEMFVDLVRKMEISHKDLPFNIYQFSTKFRDEKRARGGLLRVREFVMKDAYSFDKNEEEFKKTYELMKKTYSKIYERLGLQTTIVESDNGYIGGEYCHEFVVESDAGESKYYIEENNNSVGDDLLVVPHADKPGGLSLQKYGFHEDICKFKRDNINLEEPEKPFEIIGQPEWVQSMKDMAKHYGLPTNRFLKNVVYKNKVNKEIIVATLRGDLDINQIKLEHAIKAEGLLEKATEEDLKKIGVKKGYVHSWGYENYPQVRLIGDLSLTTAHNFIGGLKTEMTDAFNVNYGRDFKCEILADIAMVKDGFLSENNKKLISKKGIEVGNIFQLGYHYTSLMKGANYINENGMEEKFYMGCYGIGLGRSLAAIVEKHNDEKGILWPDSVSPFRYHLITLLPSDNSRRDRPPGLSAILDLAHQLEEKLGDQLLWDDRPDVSAGAKFADADLIGCPIRLVISEKTNGKIEVKKRNEKESKLISVEELLEKNV